MSKVEELKLKYPSVTSQIFDKFVDADKTPTKKYLEFLLKSWYGRSQNNNCPPTSKNLIDYVNRFDSLMPYIQNKDIYSKMYSDLNVLRRELERAEEVKEEKTFNREEHAKVIIETDKYILLQPLTHKGSLKYGSSTRWCTASKHNSQTFLNYTKKGLLIYLLDKGLGKTQNYQKVAFYLEYNIDPMSGEVVIYNANDTVVGSNMLVTNEWDEDELFKIVMTIRGYFAHIKKTKKSKDYLESFSKTIQSLNFEEFGKQMKVLEETNNNDYISSLKEKVQTFMNKLNNLEYGFTKTKN